MLLFTDILREYAQHLKTMTYFAGTGRTNRVNVKLGGLCPVCNFFATYLCALSYELGIGFTNHLILELILGKGNLITCIHHYIKKQISMKCCILLEQHEEKKQKKLTEYI